ncbi:hypothetical protein C7S16_4522 [Burkholderia thailandensis]|uniref:Uncharacterized protein n=1 Tax=Burkholderia thailandensis TaxID=57975 RepID=A0AAW9CTJ2_BURTH|nr:hypothetical protein [Burkholderia thailandensis]
MRIAQAVSTNDNQIDGPVAGGDFLRQAIDEITHRQSLNLYEHSSFRNEIVYKIAVLL